VLPTTTIKPDLAFDGGNKPGRDITRIGKTVETSQNRDSSVIHQHKAPVHTDADEEIVELERLWPFTGLHGFHG
jgi:hypothetical protein